MHAHVAYDACLSRVHLVAPREDRRGGVRVLVRQADSKACGLCASREDGDRGEIQCRSQHVLIVT